MLEQMTVMEILSKVGAIKKGHFVYRSGLHGSTYLDKMALYPDLSITQKLCGQLAQVFINDDIEVVLGAANGGIILSFAVACALSEISRRTVLSLFAEKGKNSPEIGLFPAHQALIKGKRVLIVEDVVTTGSTVKTLIALAKNYNVEVVGLGAIRCRGKDLTEEVNLCPKIHFLATLELEHWPVTRCPLCLKGEPISYEFGYGS